MARQAPGGIISPVSKPHHGTEAVRGRRADEVEVRHARFEVAGKRGRAVGPAKTCSYLVADEGEAIDIDTIAGRSNDVVRENVLCRSAGMAKRKANSVAAGRGVGDR